jgi:hypothetical protein
MDQFLQFIIDNGASLGAWGAVLVAFATALLKRKSLISTVKGWFGKSNS